MFKGAPADLCFLPCFYGFQRCVPKALIAASFAKILRWLALPYCLYCQRLAALSFGKVKPLCFGRLKYGCPEPRVFRASPGTLLANALFIRASGAPARKRPIHADFRACTFAHLITTKHPKPLRRSRRRGAAWRKQGLDCLSVSELSSPPPSNPRQGVFCAWGRLSLLTFFDEAKKVSGVRCHSAQRHQEEFREWKVSAQTLAILVFSFRAPARQPVYLGHLRGHCPEALYP